MSSLEPFLTILGSPYLGLFLLLYGVVGFNLQYKINQKYRFYDEEIHIAKQKGWRKQLLGITNTSFAWSTVLGALSTSIAAIRAIWQLSAQISLVQSLTTGAIALFAAYMIEKIKLENKSNRLVQVLGLMEAICILIIIISLTGLAHISAPIIISYWT